jgi:ribosome-associated toxin RatA of RatAB toxin-antitoxin module
VPTIKIQEKVRAPQSWLFDLSQDYSRRLNWDPFSESYSFLTPDCVPRVGAELSGRAKNGFTMYARYIAFNPPEGAAFEMVSGPWFFRTFAGAWRFAQSDPDCTTVSFNYSFTVRPGFMSWLFEPILRRSLERHVRARIAGLKAYAESTYAHRPDRDAVV